MEVLYIYKDEIGIIRVQKLLLSLDSRLPIIKVLIPPGLSKNLRKKHFGAYTLDGAYRYAYTAYVDESIDQWEITQDIADTIFMMAEKEKHPV